MSKFFAAVDLGGTSIRAAIANENAEVLKSLSAPTDSHEGPDAVVMRIGDLVQGLMRQIEGDSNQLVGLGMGVPGLVDVETGTTKFLPNLPTQWREVPVASKLQDQLQCPVRLLNDVRTATLGELGFGHGQQNPNMTLAFFSLGTGVGGGVAIDGKIRLGPLGAAGELGHQTILVNGPQCGCGNRGCLETLASGPAIAAEGIRLMRMGLAPNLHQLVEGNERRVTTRQMSEVADRDDAIRTAIVIAATHLGIATANVVTILHPDMVVLGGGVAEIGDLLVDTVRSVVRQRVRMFPINDVQIEKSLLGDQAGLIGAVALAIDAAND